MIFPGPGSIRDNRLVKLLQHYFCYLFYACREVCDDFEDVVCFSKILTDVRFLCTNHSDGQTRT